MAPALYGLWRTAATSQLQQANFEYSTVVTILIWGVLGLVVLNLVVYTLDEGM